MTTESVRRIVHVTNDFHINGTGITDFVRSLAIAQAHHGDEVTILCLRSDDTMQRMMTAHRVHVVLSTGPMSWIRRSNASAQILSRADVIHVHTVRALGLGFILAPTRFPTHSVATVHNPYGRFAALLNLAAMTVVLASSATSSFPSRGRHMFIPNPIIDPMISPPEHPGSQLPNQAVLYVGGLSHRKGTDVLLDSWASVITQVPGATLHLVGNRDAPEFETMAQERGLAGSVTFHDLRLDPRPYMRSTTLFVLPSRREGFPLVVLQARAAGAAIIATAVDGTPDSLDGGTAGVLIPEDDSLALSSAVVRLLLDESEREGLRQRASTGLDRFSVVRIAERYDAAYAMVAGARADPVTGGHRPTRTIKERKRRF